MKEVSTLEHELTKAFNNALIYGTGIVRITNEQNGKPIVKSLEPKEVIALAKHYEENIVEVQK